MRYKPKNIAAVHIALGGFARQDAGRDGTRRRSIRKDGWRPSEVDDVARKFSDNYPAGTSPRKRSKNQQGCHSDALADETLDACPQLAHLARIKGLFVIGP
jgi:hypothetical protein